MRQTENARLNIRFDKIDETEFARIFELFRTNVKAYAYYRLENMDDAEDVMQELFIRLWTKRASLNIHGDLGTYLISATHNLCTNKLKKNQRYALRKQKYAEDAEPELTLQPSADKDSELTLEIKQLLKKVPPKSRKAFEMIFFRQMSYKEAAAQAGVSETTLKTQVQNVLKSIRPKLAGKKGKGPSKKSLFLFIYFFLQSCL
ncbi:RNA polymerase sigma factor [Chitinophaga sp. S165]|uniref:RNA polymerase sigma factor n=1 Tax=Chitinophaga sp. S165 TaxID=2135462 RepID=UPI000D7174B3|nr:sigma-70 family RNA polymerase sigma factor [Chitinophaga sp. S165]PWV56257.1 RNA polymerase sigma-70 factor (ECF subfamily) [Chitinophaga sp. S165]